MEEKELRLIADQLSCPSGEAGVEVGNKMNELNQFITHRAIEKLSVKKAELIVEIGPGNGILSAPILDSLGPDGRYIAIEMSEAMAAELKQTLADKHCKTDVIRGDCLGVNLEPESVDGVIAINVLYFIEDLLPFFVHLFNWLVLDGRVVFGIRSDKTLNNLPFTQYGFNVRSISEIKSLMTKAGFGKVESFTFDEGMAPFEDMMIPVDSVIIVGEKS